MKKLGIVFGLFIIGLLIYTQLTIFVIQPIGAIPDGRTVVMLRLNKTKFIDSADAFCKREMEVVSLLCRGMTLATIANNAVIIARLPYSHNLYLISTDGAEYN